MKSWEKIRICDPAVITVTGIVSCVYCLDYNMHMPLGFLSDLCHTFPLYSLGLGWAGAAAAAALMSHLHTGSAAAVFPRTKRRPRRRKYAAAPGPWPAHKAGRIFYLFFKIPDFSRYPATARCTALQAAASKNTYWGPHTFQITPKPPDTVTAST